MKRKKFEALVNLYLDKEISASGLLILKEELKADPERRRVFKQYCGIHKASQLALLRNFPSFALEIDRIPVAPGYFTPSMSKRRLYTYAASGLAACFAAAAILYIQLPSTIDTPLPGHLPATETAVEVVQNEQPLRKLASTIGSPRILRDNFSLTAEILPGKTNWERYFNENALEFVDFPEPSNLEEIWPERGQLYEREATYQNWPEMRYMAFPVRDSRDSRDSDFQFEPAGLRFGR